MRTLEFTVPDSFDGKKVEEFLRSYCKISYRLLIRLKRTYMGITVNGVHRRSIDILRSGDFVELRLPEDEKPAQAVCLPIEVLFEDEDVIVLNKPPGMPVHPSRGHECDTLANAFAWYMQEKGKVLAFRPVNRLDRDTSGIVVAAKHSYSAARLAGGIDNSYFAVCQGKLQGSGTIDLPIGLKPGHGITRQVRQDGERAVTHYTVLGSAGGHTVLRLKLETGRTHQIRVHMSSQGYPLAGDDMYGGSRLLIGRQALHCECVSFIHPCSGQKIVVKSPLPKDMQELLEKLSFVYK